MPAFMAKFRQRVVFLVAYVLVPLMHPNLTVFGFKIHVGMPMLAKKLLCRIVEGDDPRRSLTDDDLCLMSSFVRRDVQLTFSDSSEWTLEGAPVIRSRDLTSRSIVFYNFNSSM
jgi:hypothetical protein